MKKLLTLVLVGAFALSMGLGCKGKDKPKVPGKEDVKETAKDVKETAKDVKEEAAK